jgi:LemA protein
MTTRLLPSNLTAMAFGYKVKLNFMVENEKEIAKLPKVEFGFARGQSQNKATTK